MLLLAVQSTIFIPPEDWIFLVATDIFFSALLAFIAAQIATMLANIERNVAERLRISTIRLFFNFMPAFWHKREGKTRREKTKNSRGGSSLLEQHSWYALEPLLLLTATRRI